MFGYIKIRFTQPIKKVLNRLDSYRVYILTNSILTKPAGFRYPSEAQRGLQRSALAAGGGCKMGRNGMLETALWSGSVRAETIGEHLS